MLGSDSNSDTAPSIAAGVELPAHVLAINALGLHLLDYLPFEDLVPRCRHVGAAAVREDDKETVRAATQRLSAGG